MKLNKSEKKILECIRDKKPLPADKKGRYNIYVHRAIVSLISRKLIHLCDENHWCISDQGKVDKMLENIAPVKEKISSGDKELDLAFRIALKKSYFKS